MSMSTFTALETLQEPLFQTLLVDPVAVKTAEDMPVIIDLVFAIMKS
jgi:hypothetical protein